LSNPIPSSLSLAVIANGQLGDATPIANNYSQIQAAVNALITALSGGAAGQFFQAVDGSDVKWGIVPGSVIAQGTKTANVATTGTTFATGADVLAAPLSFTADGSSNYVIRVEATDWFAAPAGVLNVNLNLDGADAGGISVASPGTGVAASLGASTILLSPSAGTHTVNARLFVTSGSGSTGTIEGGSGGAGAKRPILVSIEHF
jgi:hypothetical protein